MSLNGVKRSVFVQLELHTYLDSTYYASMAPQCAGANPAIQR